jgi:hypothetical protein
MSSLELRNRRRASKNTEGGTLLKKIGIPVLALCAMTLIQPKQANAAVRFGVFIGGPLYAYPAYPPPPPPPPVYYNPYPAYPVYPYAAPVYAYRYRPYWRGGYEYRGYRGHRRHEWREREGHDRWRR